MPDMPLVAVKLKQQGKRRKLRRSVLDQHALIIQFLPQDKKDPELEKRVEDVLDAHEVFYNKSETWISSERLYEVLYIFGWEA